MEIITLLSKYSVDCIAASLFSCFVVCMFRKHVKINEKAARLLPFGVAFFIYASCAIFKLLSFDEVIAKSMTAGGLATVIYAFLGGYSMTSEEELKDLLSTVLKSVVITENIDKVTKDILDGLYEDNDESLKTIKISDLIRANLAGETDEEKVNIVANIFVNAYKKLATKKRIKK